MLEFIKKLFSKKDHVVEEETIEIAGDYETPELFNEIIIEENWIDPETNTFHHYIDSAEIKKN